jgi:hypothetical protein
MLLRGYACVCVLHSLARIRPSMLALLLAVVAVIPTVSVAPAPTLPCASTTVKSDGVAYRLDAFSKSLM